MKQPPPLRYNDKAMIISPSGNIEGHIVQDAVNVLEEWRLRPEISKNALSRAGRFSGTIDQRLEDLQYAFDNPEIKVVLCSRGGYGAVHLLDKINFTAIKRSPKWVVGYSDITALHAALQKHGIASIHGPMASHFSNEGSEDISLRYLKSVLARQSINYNIPIIQKTNLTRLGLAEGRLFGGNLSVLCGILGSKYFKVPRKGILFIEDIGEIPYKIDRMIYQLKLSGVFNKISGLIVGKFTDFEEDLNMYSPLYDSIFNAVSEYNFPICFNFPVGHVKLNFPLIMGEKAFLNVEDYNISFKQSIRN